MFLAVLFYLFHRLGSIIRCRLSSSCHLYSYRGPRLLRDSAERYREADADAATVIERNLPCPVSRSGADARLPIGALTLMLIHLLT